MDIFIFTGVVIQLVLLLFFFRKLGKSCLGKVGFLFVGTSFVYHGLTEIAQAIFPGRGDLYRVLTTPDSVREWVLLVSGALALFTLFYFLTAERYSPTRRLPELIGQLDSAYLLKWQVLLLLGLPTFVLVALRSASDDSSGYWISGLSDQFTGSLLSLAFATMCVKYHGKRFLSLVAFFSIVLIASGERSQVLFPAVLAISTMVRYGIPLSSRNLFCAAAILAGCFVAISSTRGSYGRFGSGETFGQRLEAVASDTVSSEGISKDAVLDDTIYRFDANSFGAAILQQQQDGYGTTGFNQLRITFAYLIPSFIFKGKLDLDDTLRNEEGYQIVYYDLAELNWVATVWTALLCYVGPYGVLICGALLGWVFAVLDTWVARNLTVSAYLAGVWVTTVPLVMEGGVAAVVFALRGLPVMVVVAQLLKNGRVWKKSSKAFAPLAANRVA